jgi:hypothetical protein
MASNRALKSPTPKPRERWRSMISKKNVGRVLDAAGEYLEEVAGLLFQR